MSCKSCGREPENGTPTHWLGCEAVSRPAKRPGEYELIVPSPPGPLLCELGGCGAPRRPPGKGPKPKYCTKHSDPKTRR